MEDTTKNISTLIERQLPGFITSSYPNFQAFLEAYYQYLEQANNTLSMGKTIERSKNLLPNADIDTSIDAFSEKLYGEFMKYFPQTGVANRKVILKNIKDFYRSRGSEKSFQFLFRALYGLESSIYLPKTDILKASGGTWQIDKSLKVHNITVNGQSEDTPDGAALFVATLVNGNTSTAQAVVERVTTSFINNALVFELYLSRITGTFLDGESIMTTDVFGNVLEAEVFSGIVSLITVTNGGSLYNIGDPVVFTSINFQGNNAVAFVSAISSGNLVSAGVQYGAAGFQIGDALLIVSDSGVGANGFVATVDTTLSANVGGPSYNICMTTLGSVGNNQMNVANYGVVGNAISSTSNANTTFANSFVYLNFVALGPVSTIIIDQPGNGYLTPPTITALANTQLLALGILGRMKINNGGVGYLANDQLLFTNTIGCLGVGANAHVVSVNATGSITHVLFTQNTGQVLGGSGYDSIHFPSITVSSANGSAHGANIVCVDILGTDAIFNVATSTIGAVQQITVSDPGIGYDIAPLVSLANSGDGMATAYANVISGTFTYPGRYVDDTSTLSTHSFLQDRDYYQNYSYDVRVSKSIAEYREYVRNLVHPAGMKLWGSFTYGGTNVNSFGDQSMVSVDRQDIGIYTANAVLFQSAFLNTTSSLIATRGSKGTLSLWINFPNGFSSNLNQSIVQIGNLTLKAVNTSTSNTFGNYLELVGLGADSNVNLDIKTNLKDAIQGNDWIHFLSSWDLTTNSANIWLTNVQSSNVQTLVFASNIAYNTAIASVGAGNTTSENIALSEIWFSNTYMDISDISNRLLFISSFYEPVNLGPTGNTPLGSTPPIYLNQDANTANQNMGTSANLTSRGTVLTANTSPSSI